MRRWTAEAPEREGVSALLEEMEVYAAEMEDIRIRLSDYVEEYMDDMDEVLERTNIRLEGAVREHRMNRILLRELNAGRKELGVLLRLLEENGISPPEGKYIHYSRIVPDLCGQEQDPDLPFMLQDPEEHYYSMLHDQAGELIMFEETTPMTTAEREALREHVIRETGFCPEPYKEWALFLDWYREKKVGPE